MLASLRFGQVVDAGGRDRGGEAARPIEPVQRRHTGIAPWVIEKRRPQARREVGCLRVVAKPLKQE
jgi:hypothetical protein